MSDNPFESPPPAAAPQPPGPLPPWGFVGTVLWTLLAAVASLIVQLIAVIVLTLTVDPPTSSKDFLSRLASDPRVLAVATIVGSPIWIAIVAIAARVRRWTFRDYMALIVPSRRELLFAIGCVLALLVALTAVNSLLGHGSDRFTIETFKSARSPAVIASLFVAIVIAAPIYEEIVFRGFVFQGLSQSFVGVVGAIVLTSGIWAVMHAQYGWYSIFQVFLFGVLFGWLRWTSGSTLLTIILHVMQNGLSFVLAMYFFSSRA